MKINIIILIILVTAIGFFVWQRFFRNDFDLPKGGETTTETITIKNGQVVETKTENELTDFERPKAALEREEQERNIAADFQTTKEIMVTDGVKHSIPLEEILQGCPSRDCIPSIDNPAFESISSANSWLDDAAPGIAFSRGNTARFYPYDILVSHEIVNDTVEGQRVLISYCPLCLTAVVFDPLVRGERAEFGVSGLLWESNLIMYDRKTDTLWSQVLGEAIMGDLTGTVLPKLPSDQALYGNWKKANSQGEVLAKGFLRGFGSGNPYAATHFDISGTAISFARPTDDRLPFGAQVFGIVVNGKAKAYHIDAVRAAGKVSDMFEGQNIELRHNKDLDVVRIFEILQDGTEIRINPLSGFWFSWAEAHPDTELFK